MKKKTLRITVSTPEAFASELMAIILGGRTSIETTLVGLIPDSTSAILTFNVPDMEIVNFVPDSDYRIAYNHILSLGDHDFIEERKSHLNFFKDVVGSNRFTHKKIAELAGQDTIYKYGDEATTRGEVLKLRLSNLKK